ncbi:MULTISPECIES: hypothetical protein [unclassified Streptomyces]|uniref:hypothetical protein n=1 Tax=unclassified Streptomyces TaxID=2593676 RepID=UPI0011B05EFD|nr:MULTISPECIES: hypothetical protein [unclassified Streptomyces]
MPASDVSGLAELEGGEPPPRYRDMSLRRIMPEVRRAPDRRPLLPLRPAQCPAEPVCNGHFSIHELCDICPASQLDLRTNAW